MYCKNLQQNLEMEQAIKIHNDILKEEGIDINQIQNHYLQIKDFYMYSFNSKLDKNKPNILLIHGFLLNSLDYLKMFKNLSKTFNVYSIDIIGLCMSSYKIPKEDLTIEKEINIFNDNESCLNYHIEAIEEWRNKMEINNFYLMGHSMGGYLSSHYTAKYPHNVKDLFLLSPGGFNKGDKIESKKRFQERIKNINCIIKYFLSKNVDKLFKEKKDIFECLGIFKNTFLNKYYQRKSMKFTKTQSEMYINLIKHTLKNKNEGLKSLNHLFIYGPQSLIPIIEIYPKLLENKKKVFIYFGCKDWMDKEDIKNNLFKLNYENNISIISDCYHQLPLENPEGVLKQFFID